MSTPTCTQHCDQGRSCSGTCSRRKTPTLQHIVQATRDASCTAELDSAPRGSGAVHRRALTAQFLSTFLATFLAALLRAAVLIALASVVYLSTYSPKA